jgi:hypothetical protein
MLGCRKERTCKAFIAKDIQEVSQQPWVSAQVAVHVLPRRSIQGHPLVGEGRSAHDQVGHHLLKSMFKRSLVTVARMLHSIQKPKVFYVH